MKCERGSTLLEVLVALALLGIISVSFLSATMTTTKSRVTADERASAKILAEGMIDDIKKESYRTSYDVIIPDAFNGYSADLTVDNMATSIQKLSITVSHFGHDVLTLEDYKVNR
jgi:prepilin-type N-terminal cleavage/methylation domain-containing protein